MIVEELYQDCFRFNESSLAHCIYHLLGEGKISLKDDISNIHLNQVDQQKVAELIQNNFLGIHKMCVYSLKMSQKGFVFIFARSGQEAIDFYTKTLHQTPLNCYEYSLDFQLVRGKAVISFRDMKKDINSFPAIAGYFKREG
ncbi:hypothetical protein BIV60_17215 [Bacillus sp. MUM 116]|uniref:hypothetical protein n=1 Tax=Bacillus sp. MUM 116 TaxID=1678002 RepID=UPI0008F58E5B|nr:hypothetical protein [Bacillus sp. MUM 116]OIK11924.1 hypothetical protein BIV60_17215 [Bacillus sp. MUM 116]